MRRSILAILVLLALVAGAGCAGTTAAPQENAPVVSAPVVTAPVEDVHDFVIKVTGTKGNKFSGNYMTMMADGSSTAHSVEGVVPASFKTPETDAMSVKYTMRGSIVSCFFQQQGETGVLGVAVLRDGYQVAFEWTEAAYGCVTIATP